VTLAPKGLLIEEQRTNLLTYSEQFDNAVWTKDGTPSSPLITPNTTVAPNGTLTADTITQNAAANTSRIYQVTAAASGATLTHSMYVKRSVGRWAVLFPLDGPVTNGFVAWFDLENGVVGASRSEGTGTFVSSSITPAANGFWRISITGSVPGTTVNACWFFISNANNSTTRALGGSAHIWGAQLE
jgi:hypothetical protein